GDSNCRPAYKEALKKYLKTHNGSLCEDCVRRMDTNPLRVLDCKNESCHAVVSKAPMILDHLCPDCAAAHKKVLEILDSWHIPYEVNPKIVRGLDYYTRAAFEISVAGLGSQNAVAGGGRYDGLAEELGGPKTPAIGFAMGLERLLASAVGLLTTVLAVWLWLADPRKWMRWLGVAAFLGVIAQGVLGGLRVTMHMDSLGVFHATIAQLFFILLCAITLFTSRLWLELAAGKKSSFVSRSLRTLVLGTTVLIFIQLIIAATMRHQHAGLAISDFPLAYGKIWPATNPDAVASYNARRVSVTEEAPITAFQIKLQMAHRIVALVILLLVAACARQTWQRLGPTDSLTNLAIFWLALMFAQIALGAWTIWSNKAADVATAHVMVGALSLVTGALWCLIGFVRSTSFPQTQTLGVFGVQASMMANK
ncbi:MAG: COX15/CtaA family protein, partial [Verrucomicrobiota bacterium]